ncbi:F-actin-monooxygenase MICAL2 [Hemicordylus capensis]|uniref:F-actin-monooxygenase MICAL2 n=1 Tax=Hemicordylus capensis TaxID=884348 RepID=UPI002303E158|nr:F-actin-monooxygenase MICAL2 [Hemicordylus capensis]
MPLGYSALSSWNMGEKDDEKYSQAGQIFENFVQASTCKGTIQAFNILTRQLELDPLDNRNFYAKLKSKVTSWKAKALWNKLDKRASHKEYKRGKACVNTKCLIVGGGPCGLRTAIELAFLGAKVIVVEKRDTFSRNNVLHLWPFTIHDLRSLGAKKFYGKFCAGSIDHISIRQLQLILFKVALMLGVEIHVNVEFVKVLEPPEDQENQKTGWRAEFLPMDHPLSEFEFDVIIGADGRRNSLEGFRRKEFRGKLAIAITANFINRNTTAEAKVEEISGVAFIFNQKFFQDLKEETGIDLENIVYYKDSTHYFVMTAKKQSLLEKGVIINDYIDTEMLLCGGNVNQDNLLSYAREAADFATDYQLPALDFAINHYGQPDVAMFDFTSMYASENAALIRERHRHQLLVALVGDSLLEPFWPMGTGCARGFLAAFDTAWMVKSWAQIKSPLDILAERESLFRLLPQTTPDNITKNFDLYTIDPATRYPNLNSSCVRPHQVKHLYITNEIQPCPLERVSSIRRSIGLSRHESDIRPNKLLIWCQKQTEGYRNVSVTDLTTSWRSGLALCAIMHHFRPDLIDFDSLNEEDSVRNNQLAFDIAEREFGIPPVITGKEMVSAGEPDKLSMVMYLSKFYELFRGTPLKVVGSVDKQNGERNDLCSAKSSNLIFNNYINLTFPRKRIPKAEENETNKRRRKSLINFEESSSVLNRGANSGKQLGDVKEGINQNKVKSMATQLLAKLEENAPSISLRRQELVDKPALHLSSVPPINPRFAKPENPTCSPPPAPKRQFQVVARAEHTVRESMQSLPGPDPMTRHLRSLEHTELESRLSETLASSCPAAFALSGVLQRLQHVEEKFNQKRAQSIANREFHKKSIKEKAAHLASMFGYIDIPKNKLPTKGLSHSQSPSPSCLPSHDSAASSSSSIDSASLAVCSKKMTVGKVSRGIGAVAEVLVNLYMNDHRPNSHSDSLHPGSLRKEFPQSMGGSDICCFCKKRVYVMERLSAEGHFFHRECFKCAICATTLRLAMYAFDAEEGKFYCKLHFAQCKTNNMHRKRRAILKSHEKEEAGLWREEPMSAEATTESDLTASTSSSEIQSPGILPSFFWKTLSWPLKVTRDLLGLPRRLSNWMHGSLHSTRLHFRDNAYNYKYLYELLSFSMPFLYALQELLANIYREVELSCENLLEMVKKFFCEKEGQVACTFSWVTSEASLNNLHEVTQLYFNGNTFLFPFHSLDGYYTLDEPISPKKFKNVPEIDSKSSCSSVSSEWALVRIIPEEEMTEHNLLAVRVMVTSDGSSSELEPDFYGDPSISEFNNRLSPLPDLRNYTLPSRKPLPLNTNLMKKGDSCEKSKAANALQRANSLRDSSTLKKYQNWKKKIQPNFPLLYSKKIGPSSKNSYANIQSDFEDDLFQTELTSPNKIPEISSGDFKSHSTAFQRKGEATDVPGEIPSYVPHFSFHNSTDSCPLTRSKSFHYSNMASTPSYTEHGSGEYSIEDQYLENRTLNREQLTLGLFIKNSDTSSANRDEGDKMASTSTKEQHDRHLNKAKNKIIRKLTLSMEQQSKLRSLSDAKLDGTRTEQQGQGMHEQKNAYFNRYENIPKKSSCCRSLKFSDNHSPILSPELKLAKNVDNGPKEHMAGQPKSPLRLIASAIKRSIIEPLIPPPEGLKNSQDTHAKLPSENTFFSFPHTFVHSVRLRNSKNHGECDLQMQEPRAGKRLDSDRSNFSSSLRQEYDTGASFPVYSMHKSSCKTEDVFNTNVDDVPTLLEKFTLKENLWKSSRDDLYGCNQKNNLYSSLRLRNKSTDAILDNHVQRNNIWNLFGNVRNKADDRDKNLFLMPVPSSTIFDVDEVLRNSSNGEYVGSEPVRKQVTDYSSSSDSELEHKPPLPHKTKRILKRSRKLEKETKQLVKQEELKRLHKAQAIQRLLEEVEEKQRALEVYGVQLERELRGESDPSIQDETRLLHEWFELVLEKNTLMRYESELLIIAKELELEDHQTRLEYN